MNRLISKSEFYWYNKFKLQNSRAAIKKTFAIHFLRYKSHYSSLGVDSNASQKDIKSAYYNLSLKFHPDKNKGSSESVEKFREISEAYEVLGSPEKRKVYDESMLSAGIHHQDFRRNDFAQRSSEYYRRPPQTGRTKYYNYDEHYRQHYEEYMRQREVEYEFLKRRWKADQRDRYGHDWYEPTSRQRPNQRFRFVNLLESRSFISLISLWVLLSIASLFIENKDSAPKRIFYDTQKENDGKIYYKVKDVEIKNE